MKQNKKIAITGGIGSGKSTVSRIIADAGYTVLSCDEIYSLLLKDGLTQIIGEKFKGVLDENGELNRKALAEIVFSDGQKLEELRKLTNGEVINYAINKMDATDGTSFCEVPLLFENGFERLFDGVIVVKRDLNERIKSVAKRDKLSEEQVISRISSQFNYDTADLTKYYVIHNNGDLDELKKKTHSVIEIITE